MSRRLASAAAALYGIAAIVTFGHAAAAATPCAKPVIGCTRQARAIMSGLVAAPLWPLYWSWEAWS